MAYITDQEVSRQQAESLARILRAQALAQALTEAQKTGPKPKVKKQKEINKNGSK